MTFTITWWMVVIVLVAIPFIYGYFRKSGGDYDFQIDTMIIAAACWMFALGVTVTKIWGWLFG